MKPPSAPDFGSEIAPNSETFCKDILVRFSDCDPAGIVFYPKYFEMFNSIIEDWCREGLHFSFVEIVARRGWGLPTVHLETDFLAPSTYGEVLKATLRLCKLGNSSITLEIRLRGGDGALRVSATAVLALIDRATVRAIPFPEEIRERFSALLTAAPAGSTKEPK
jgi:4-hydroxybenzoyl-CoA thioesterase